MWCSLLTAPIVEDSFMVNNVVGLLPNRSRCELQRVVPLSVLITYRQSMQMRSSMDIGKSLIMCVMRTMVLAMIFKLVMVDGAPIKIDFTTCKDASYAQNFLSNATIVTLSCCPPLPTKPILEGIPAPMSSGLRVRQASQCTDEAYKAKIEKAYALMKALPDDDPRSFKQQWHLHCSHCGGSFFTNPNNASTAIDVHFSWLFLPWHRYYLYFHERILQSLLGDPTFSLNYWNWDGPYTIGDGSLSSGKCNKAGADFPTIYTNSTSSLYNNLRSDGAKGTGPFLFPDLTFSSLLPASEQYRPNITADDWIASNLNVMYQIMVSGGTTAPIFMGRAYREGDLKGFPAPTGGPGILESMAHPGVHFWTGMDPPFNLSDMGLVATAARDPVFFAHHSNVDRLFHLWKDIGPQLGVDREYYNDPDFLNAEFLFYDENQDLRRVSPKDALDTKNFGYVYEDISLPWMDLNVTSCSPLSYNDTLAQATMLPAPVKHSDGSYHLAAKTSFVIIVDRPPSPQGREEFLTISGITLNRCNNGGFDVYVDLLTFNLLVPTKCAEYVGSFSNMATASYGYNLDQTFVFKASITRTLTDILVPGYASKLAITIVPKSSTSGTETITFKDIFIGDE